MLIAGLEQGTEIGPLAHAILEAHWRDDADFASAETLAALAEKIAIDAAPLLAAALTPEIRVLYAKNTEEAIQRSVFGSTTYFVDGDMFYGQDRLEMIERALQQPFSGKLPRT